jgi:hypothetical protein
MNALNDGMQGTVSCKIEKIFYVNEKKVHFAYYLLPPNPIKHEK